MARITGDPVAGPHPFREKAGSQPFAALAELLIGVALGPETTPTLSP